MHYTRWLTLPLFCLLAIAFIGCREPLSKEEQKKADEKAAAKEAENRYNQDLLARDKATKEAIADQQERKRRGGY